MNRITLTLLAALAPLGLSSTNALAQSCTVPAPTNQELHPVWGGETWATFTLEVGSDHRIWTGEDGGRIRTSWDGGTTWQYAATPTDFAGSILDIWFEDDGLTGYAGGRNGRALKSIDGGLTWTNLNPTPIFDGRGDLATIWGIRSLHDGTLLMTGNWLFRISYDGGATWPPVNIYDRYPSLPGATPIQASGLRLFRLDVVSDGTNSAGSVGALWEENSGGGWNGPPDGKDHPVILHTNTNLPLSYGASAWWIAYDEGPVPAEPAATLFEPWSVRFAAGSSSVQSSIGFAIGGRGGNHASNFYMTTNSGRSWTYEGQSAVTMYDVAARTNGDAMIVGYSGTYMLRDGATGAWTSHTMPSPSTMSPTPGFSTGALEGVGVFGTEGWVAVGDFGSQRITFDNASTWASMSDYYPGSDELELRVFDAAFPESAPLEGCIVGQFGIVLYTADGGCNWSLAYDAPDDAVVAIDINDAGQGVAVGRDGSLLHSTTGGASWSTGAYVVGTAYPLGLTAADIRYEDVCFSATNEAWAIGAFSNGTPVIAYSGDGGANWVMRTGPAVANLEYGDIAWSDANGGILLATDAGGAQHAFAASFSGGLLSWTTLTVPGSTTLKDVALSSASLASATGFAVGTDGTNGVILEWTGSGFAVPSGVVSTGIELRAVDVDSTGSAALIGGVYDNDPLDSADRGFLVRYDATNGWDSLRAFCGKDVVGIALTSDEDGYVAGQTLGASASFINGNLASSILLRYLED